LTRQGQLVEQVTIHVGVGDGIDFQHSLGLGRHRYGLGFRADLQAEFEFHRNRGTHIDIVPARLETGRLRVHVIRVERKVIELESALAVRHCAAAIVRHGILDIHRRAHDGRARRIEDPTAKRPGSAAARLGLHPTGESK